MTVYEHKTSLTASGGETNTVTLKIPGGRLKNVLVRANTDTTVFRANLSDGTDTRINWDYEVGELVDDTVDFPVCGEYTFNITNASPDDTFRVILSVSQSRSQAKAIPSSMP